MDHVDVPGLNVTGASLRSGGCSTGAGSGLNQHLGMHEHALKPTHLSLAPSATVQQRIHLPKATDISKRHPDLQRVCTCRRGSGPPAAFDAAASPAPSPFRLALAADCASASLRSA